MTKDEITNLLMNRPVFKSTFPVQGGLATSTKSPI